MNRRTFFTAMSAVFGLLGFARKNSGVAVSGEVVKSASLRECVRPSRCSLFAEFLDITREDGGVVVVVQRGTSIHQDAIVPVPQPLWPKLITNGGHHVEHKKPFRLPNEHYALASEWRYVFRGTQEDFDNYDANPDVLEPVAMNENGDLVSLVDITYKPSRGWGQGERKEG